MQHPRGRAEALGNPCFLEGPVIRPLKTFRGPDGTCLKGTTVKPGTVRTVVHHDQAEAGSSNISLNFHPKSLIGNPVAWGRRQTKPVSPPDLWPTALRCEALLASSAVCWMAKICGEIVIRGIFRSIAIHRFKCLIRARADPPSFGSKSNPEIATSVHGVRSMEISSALRMTTDVIPAQHIAPKYQYMSG
jgi:hypothetical protein